MNAAVNIPGVRELRILYSPLKATGPLPQVGRPADAVTILRERLEREPVEVVLVLLLNTKHRVIGVHEVGRGTLDACLVHPRLCWAEHKRGWTNPLRGRRYFDRVTLVRAFGSSLRF